MRHNRTQEERKSQLSPCPSHHPRPGRHHLREPISIVKTSRQTDLFLSHQVIVGPFPKKLFLMSYLNSVEASSHLSQPCMSRLYKDSMI